MTTEQEFITFIKEYLSMKIPNAKCSDLLLSQFCHMPDFGGMRNPFMWVVDEIELLEGTKQGGSTKKAEAFNRKEMSGLWKKHFYIPSYHLGANAGNALGINAKTKWLEDTIKKISKKYAGSPDTDETRLHFSKDLANEASLHVIQRRNNSKNTGDYLVFLPYNEKNYYLCIAKHKQDDFIRECVGQCLKQFPFLINSLPNYKEYTS